MIYLPLDEHPLDQSWVKAGLASWVSRAYYGILDDDLYNRARQFYRYGIGDKPDIPYETISAVEELSYTLDRYPVMEI